MARGTNRVALCCAAVLLAAGQAARATTTLDETDDVIPATASVNASPTFFAVSQAVDNETLENPSTGDNGVVFQGGDGGNAQVMAVADFGPTALGAIRLHTVLEDGSRVPASVAIRSSTTVQTVLTASSYETVLGTFVLGPAAFAQPSPVQPGENPPLTEYAELSVSAPAGTRSLFFDFTGSLTGTRIAEVQAYVVPEPAAAALLAAAAALAPMRSCRRRRVARAVSAD